MPVYTYLAKSGGKTHKGYIEATSKAEALRKLAQMGYERVLSIKESKTVAKQKVYRKKIPLQALVMSTRQLATLLSAGMQLVEALEIVAQQATDPYLAQVFADIALDLRKGESDFAGAIAKRGDVFPAIFASVVRGGQESGKVAEALDELATSLEKTLALVRKVKSAMTYPLVVLTISFSIFLGIVVFIIPKFEQMFKDMGIKKMPALTVFMIGVARFFIHYWMYIVGAIVLLFVINYFGGLRFRVGGRLWHSLILKIPIIGDIVRNSILAQFASVFATMVRSGISPVTALDNLREILGNKLYQDALTEVLKKVRSGHRISAVLRNYPNLFPPMFVNMMRIGEETGKSDVLMEKLADYYRGEVDAAVERLASALEPLTVFVLAVLVGTAIVSIYLPIFSMIGQMKL